MKARKPKLLEGESLLQHQNVYLKRKVRGLKAQRKKLKDKLATLMAAANKVILAFPDYAPADFDIPAYIIEELRKAAKEKE